MFTERAYAKLNLSLDVLGKLPGGYHELCMVMESVDLCDEVEIELRRDGEVRLETAIGWLPKDRRNLAVAAVYAFREALGDETLGADIRLKKRIPVGAGMAGGSTDGAAVLRALNHLCGRPFDADALRRAGLTLGSDVPYCVAGGSMLAGGRGEKLEKLPMPPDCALVIAKPVFSLSTADLFSRVDSRHARTRPDTRGLIRAMEEKDAPGMARRMFNVFEDVLPRHCGEVGVIRGALLEEGALGAVMTGTGSAVFGIFTRMDEAEKAAVRLRQDYRDVFTARFVDELEV